MIRVISRFLLGGYRQLPRPVWAIFFIQIILRGGDFVFPFLTLLLTRKLGLTGAAAGFWIMANVASGLVGTLVSGKVSDHLGRKQVMGACMVGTGLLTGLCGFLPPSMLIPRVLVAAAFFQGSMKPILSASIMDLCAESERKAAFSLSYLGVNLGVAIGPMFAGFLFENHLSWVFFGNSVALGCALLLVLKLVPNIRLDPAAHLNDSERAVEGTALKAFLERPLLVMFCILTLFVSFAYGQINFGLTLYASEAFGARGAANFGFLMSFNAIVVLSSTAILTRLTHTLSGPAAMGIGAGLYAIGFGMIAFRPGMALLTASTLIWTLGEVLLAINMGAYLASHTPRNFRGRFQSIREFMASAGRLMSPVVFGIIITHLGSLVAWMATALVALGCAAGFAVLHRWDQEIPEPQATGEHS